MSEPERRVGAQRPGSKPEEETKTYVVKEGQVWGTNPELKAGDTVELTEAEAAGFLDKLEPANESAAGLQRMNESFQSPEGSQAPQAPQPPTTPSVPRKAS